jgi:rhamnosyltransferase subunit B
MMKKRVLLAWENGSGLGHAKRVLQVALELKAHGYETVVAAREIGPAQMDYRAAGIQVLQAPIHRGFVGDARNYRAQGYADIMATAAWDEVEALHAAVHAWDGLLALIKPDLVVSDYCPILPLAVLNRVPLIVFGDGFAVPPREGNTLPLVRPRNAPRADDRQLIANGDEVLRRRDETARITSLGALMNGDRSVVCTYPELDIYHQYREQKATGPLEAQSSMPVANDGYLYVYLAADHSWTEKAVEGAAATGLQVRAFIRNSRREQREAWRVRGIFVHDVLPNLKDELMGARAILHHGGIGTMEVALAGGRPQLLLPRHLEQSLNAARLGAQGIGVQLATPFKTEDAAAASKHVMTSADLLSKVQRLAEAISARPMTPGLDLLLHHCQEILL